MMNLISALRDKADQMPNKTAFIHITRDCSEKDKISFYQLDLQARHVALYLQDNGLTDRPLIILLGTRTDFITAFFGCIYAGVIVVPVPIPRHGKSWSRVKAIAKNAGAKTLLTDRTTLERIEKDQKRNGLLFSDYQWLTMHEIQKADGSLWQMPELPPDHLAFLQHTSGSTGRPKGVMISHENLIENIQDFSKHFGLSEDSVSVSWLPLFHDMGLIAHVILPVIMGCHTVLMDPLEFIKRPCRWLKAISQYKGTFSGAPNFAYDLCVSRISAEEQSTLDLSSWETAYNGSEPVRASTLKRFCDRFAENGFKPAAFYPVYGLAEATLMVAGKNCGETFSTLDSLEVSQIAETGHLTVQRDLVACGRPTGSQEVAIVDPVSCGRLSEGQIGEIWVCGKNVAQGYWKQTRETKAFFHARHTGDNQQQFFKTGDLGLLKDGQLFVVGRIKDILIINGANFSAEDIEYSLALCHSVLSIDGCGVFSIETENGEKAVAACEVPGAVDAGKARDIISAACRVMSTEYGILLFDLVLTDPAVLPRTTSGKLQRHICRQNYLEGVLKTQHPGIHHPCLEKHRTEASH